MEEELSEEDANSEGGGMMDGSPWLPVVVDDLAKPLSLLDD